VARLKVLQQHESGVTTESQGKSQFKESFRDSHLEPLEHKAVVSLVRLLHYSRSGTYADHTALNANSTADNKLKSLSNNAAVAYFKLPPPHKAFLTRCCEKTRDVSLYNQSPECQPQR
jgi:hypothetical protein